MHAYTCIGSSIGTGRTKLTMQADAVRVNMSRSPCILLATANDPAISRSLTCLRRIAAAATTTAELQTAGPGPGLAPLGRSIKNPTEG